MEMRISPTSLSRLLPLNSAGLELSKVLEPLPAKKFSNAQPACSAYTPINRSGMNVLLARTPWQLPPLRSKLSASLAQRIKSATSPPPRELVSLALKPRSSETDTGLPRESTCPISHLLDGPPPRLEPPALSYSDLANKVGAPTTSLGFAQSAPSASIVLMLLTSPCSALRDLKL